MLDALRIATGVLVGDADRLQKAQHDLVASACSLGEALTFGSELDGAVGGGLKQPFRGKAGDDAAGCDVRDAHSAGKAGHAADAKLVDQIGDCLDVVLGSFERVIMPSLEVAGS